MTDDSLLTKCPHCQTLFRIQQEHLAAAGGEVRCGVCYKVFDAESEGVAYSQGEGSPREKTFANNEGDKNGSNDSFFNDHEDIIDTSPEPEPDPKQALAAASIDQIYQDDAPSAEDISQFSINSTVNDIIASNNVSHQKRAFFKWSALNVLAICTLFAQWLFFNFEHNARSPQWQPLYSVICQTLGCELPPYQNIKAIKTERLAIKSHPEYANVLIVDMIISNTGPQSQPLPALDMTFSNLNGSPQAKRLFKPHEYLGEHLQQLPVMPSKTPIHLSFAILDPGGEAVNYSVNFSPAS